MRDRRWFTVRAVAPTGGPQRLAVLALTAWLTAGCAVSPIGGTATAAPFDPRSAFGVFGRPEQPMDQPPIALIEPQTNLRNGDTRRVVEWPGTVVYIGHTTEGEICLIADTNPPWGTTGAIGCQTSVDAADQGSIMLWRDPDGTEGMVLIPDTASATIDRGTLIAAGNGVIGIRPAAPADGIAVTLTFADGHTSHLDLTVPN